MFYLSPDLSESGGGRGRRYRRGVSTSSSSSAPEEEGSSAPAAPAEADVFGFVADAGALDSLGQRIDDQPVGLVINPKLISAFKEELLGKGTWGRKAKKVSPISSGL